MPPLLQILHLRFRLPQLEFLLTLAEQFPQFLLLFQKNCFLNHRLFWDRFCNFQLWSGYYLFSYRLNFWSDNSWGFDLRPLNYWLLNYRLSNDLRKNWLRQLLLCRINLSPNWSLYWPANGCAPSALAADCGALIPDNPIDGECWAAACAIAPLIGRPAFAPKALGRAPNALGSTPI